MNSHRAKAAHPGGRLVAGRAFVVQLYEAQQAQSAEGVCGRVENVATGENAHFESLRELDEFMRQSASRTS